MFSLTTLTIACVLGVVSGTPLATRQSATCNPNFEGAGVSIIANEVEWGVSPVVAGTPLQDDLGTFPLNATTEWHVEQTGSANPTYIIKAISNNDLVVDVVGGEFGQLTLEEIDSTKQTQIWEIDCRQCFPGASSTPGGGEFAVGCAIKSAPSGLCVTVEMGAHIFGLTNCSPVVAQTFDFWTATSA
ncbi:hypothetical protein DFH07DRAFT_1058155 [Mycena maculata]|uniref:Ricin B lectin domain-containing protein n=1 Tax=Mycena maculata TaxID=230809 RepID=A0AAD7JQG7_9AGAR|nr:hypothetical protein DFH07DRAFT_1058155 [Mycena maculata]